MKLKVARTLRKLSRVRWEDVILGTLLLAFLIAAAGILGAAAGTVIMHTSAFMWPWAFGGVVGVPAVIALVMFIYRMIGKFVRWGIEYANDSDYEEMKWERGEYK